MLTPERLAELRTEAGARLMARAETLAGEPFAAERLRREGWPAELAAAAVEMARLRRRARAKFSRADEMWFTAPLLEQASAEIVARHRAPRFARWERVGDFCCGLGGDAVALAAVTRVLAVDRDPLALALTRANAEVLGVAERVSLLLAEIPAQAPEVPAAWVDPGRREGGVRTRRLHAISPPLPALLGLRPRIPHLGIKLSPATEHAELDALLGDLPHERQVVSVHGECREMDLWLGELSSAPGERIRRATLLPSGAELAGVPEPYAEVRPPGEWLLEPDAAVLRAGLVGNLARELGAWPIDPALAYLSLERPCATSFGTLYRIEPPEPFSRRALAARLRALGAGDLVVKTRGAAVAPEALRQQLRGVLKQGRPERRLVLFVTRLGGRAMMILGERVGAGIE